MESIDGEKFWSWCVNVTDWRIALAAARVSDAKQFQYFRINRRTVFDWGAQEEDRQTDGQMNGGMGRKMDAWVDAQTHSTRKDWFTKLFFLTDEGKN